MRQRTAIARTLAMDSPYLLLDEPFGALDTKIRGQLQILLQDLWKESGKTVIFVTHDLDEAMILGSRIVFIEDGRIQHEKQIDTSINCCCRQQAGRADCQAAERRNDEVVPMKKINFSVLFSPFAFSGFGNGNLFTG